MSIYHGNQKIGEIYYGSQKIKEAYMGDQLIYQAVKDPRSWWSGDDGVKHYFDINNAPPTIFTAYTGNDPTSLITINGISVQRQAVKKIVFGESYSTVTDEFYNNFLRYFSGLVSLDIWGLSGVISMYSGSFLNLFSLTEIDLSPLVNLQPVNSLTNFFGTQPGQSVLTKIKIGSKDWSTVNVNTGFNNRQSPAGTIYAATLQLATAFRSKFNTYLYGWSVAVG